MSVTIRFPNERISIRTPSNRLDTVVCKPAMALFSFILSFNALTDLAAQQVSPPALVPAVVSRSETFL